MTVATLLLITLLFIPIETFGQQSDPLPEPYATKSTMNFSKVVGWDSLMPIAPPGFVVSKYAEGFDNPRSIYVLSNGDVLVAETNSNHTIIEKVGGTIIGANKSNNLGNSANRISILRDENQDGVLELKNVFLTNGLNQPFGMLLIGKWFYVANTDAVLRYPYKKGELSIEGMGEKIIDLPPAGRHWVRNLITNADSSKIYITVGSGSDHAEDGIDKELLRADILEMNLDGSGMEVFASGLRNPVGMAWAPGTKTLWTVVNERDELGDNLVPDYLTSVKKGGFYGWPYTYYGQHEDPRVTEKQPNLVKKAIVPDYQLGAHTASLGLAFGNKTNFPKKYKEGAFIAQHGSWNRSVLSGYKVVFVPFKNGKPSGPEEDFLTGFISDLDKNQVHGRPVAVAILKDGSILVSDDVSNTVWRISSIH